jgi:thiol-disulfide isomerase/thioredoxin
LAEPEPIGPGPAGDRARPFTGSNRIRWTALGVGLVLMALIALLAFGDDDRLSPQNELLGARVPDVSGPTLTGGRYDIDNARGRWVVVNFFATWCAGCINEHPELVAFDQWGRETGQAEVVAVVFNDSTEQVQAFFDANGGSWPVLDNPALPLEFHVSQIPETLLVAPSGLVVQHIEGEVSADALIASIEQA